MELIEDLGTRLINNKWVRYGIFLCPYCILKIEKIFKNGKIDKSCGCQRYKLSAKSNKGKKHTEETRQKMRDNRVDCRGENSPMFGKKLSEETRQKIKENHKGMGGKNHTEESRKKQSKTRIERGLSKGKNNPNWNNGSSFEPYAQEFNKELKQFILERDNYACQCPDCEEKSIILQVHHIDYDKKNNNPENLIVLCASCHTKTNSKKKRQYYTEYYQTIMMGKLMECLL